MTVGSPLAHAMLLLASGSQDFDDRKAQRELPTCPPVLDEHKYGYVVVPPPSVARWPETLFSACAAPCGTLRCDHMQQFVFSCLWGGF